MSLLTPLQKRIISILGKESLFSKGFFLTGGTALAEFYLKHRLSGDLDFFTEVDGLIDQVIPKVEKSLNKEKIKIEITKRFDTFVEMYASKGKETVKLDFAKDAPFRLKPLVRNKKLGILVDNKLDIACNKFSALFDRHDTKDFVDIYFLCHEKEFTFGKIYRNAKKKHIGLDDYWLAVSLRFVEEIDKLPKMLKPLGIEDLKNFYRKKIKDITHKTNPTSN